MSYKDTLLMPKTGFEMRGNLPINEKIQREEWEKDNLYQQIKEKNKGRIPFVLHDGPPYANGNIHIGHATNKILKDFINRYKMMSGYDMTYIPGWDTHGLPIEQAVTNSGINRKTMSVHEFRNKCMDFANIQIKKQKEDFKILNILGDFENPYITMSKECESRQIEVFAKMVKRGLIYKGLKPVYWSPSSESALAEAEIEYKDKEDISIYVAFEVVTGNNYINIGDNLVIWTTTPWTLPGNLAIAVGEDIDYKLIKSEDKRYIIASNLADNLLKKFNISNFEVIKELKGRDIDGITYKHVFEDRISPVVLGHHVTIETGTGLVHIAPGYGVDDFLIGKKYNLGLISGVNDQGILTEESGSFKGLFYSDASVEVTKKLKEMNLLLASEVINHSYPHDWRTKKPIIFRATSQWFCSIDGIRDEILSEIDESVLFHTEWGKKRLYNMIRDRGDWCISRQRVWGVPIPIFYNEDGSEIVDYDIIMHVSTLFREHGSNIWFEKEAIDLLPKGYTNIKSPNNKFTKETDIMDVWFDSGSTHTSVLVERGLGYPADVYLEGSDQYRGWFNSSIITGVSLYDKAPYKQLISTGYVLDGNGYKMSKSLGNIISPLELVEKHGSDIVRLWVSSVDFTEDMKISEDLINQVKESYRKIRNTFKFMLGNLFDFNPSKDLVKYESMNMYDKYMMVKVNELIDEVNGYYNNYKFQEIYKAINNFVSFTLSNFYLDFTKDILYVDAKDSNKRRSVQSVLYTILNIETKMLAPILPYTCEEVYKNIPGTKGSIHLTDMISSTKYNDEKEIIETFKNFFELREQVNKEIEKLRNDKLISSSFEVVVTVPDNGNYDMVKKNLSESVNQLLIVSKVYFETNITNIEVSKSTGYKCERCWNYVDKINDTVCNRCLAVVENK